MWRQTSLLAELIPRPSEETKQKLYDTLDIDDPEITYPDLSAAVGEKLHYAFPKKYRKKFEKLNRRLYTDKNESQWKNAEEVFKTIRQYQVREIGGHRNLHKFPYMKNGKREIYEAVDSIESNFILECYMDWAIMQPYTM